MRQIDARGGIALTNRELARLKRAELLRLMIEQGEALNESQQSLEQALEELDNRRLAVEKAGSLAEASAKVNKLFDAAQNTADQYIENVKLFCDEQEAAVKAHVARTEVECRQMLAKARADADKLLEEARLQAAVIVAGANKEAEETLAHANAEADRLIGEGRAAERDDARETITPVFLDSDDEDDAPVQRGYARRRWPFSRKSKLLVKT